MKRIIIFAIFIITLITIPSMVFAQPMMETQLAVSPDGHTAREEIEGKKIWEKLQAKQLECKDLTDSNFELLGEYFMGQMAGDSHEAMNTMMERMMGKDGEEQMHITMGKKLSDCGSSAATKGGGNYMMGYRWDNMMGGWGGFGLGWLFMLLFWTLIILGVIAFIRYLTKSGDIKESKAPLDILKERYAKGEIGKKEFEEKKKDL